MIGALTAKPPNPPADTLPMAVVGNARTEPRYRITREYWVTLLIVATVVTPLFLYALNMRDLDTSDFDPEAWAWLYALTFPAIQLGTSVVVGFATWFSKRPGREQRIQHLLTITVRAIVGTIIGLFIMAIFAAML